MSGFEPHSPVSFRSSRSFGTPFVAVVSLSLVLQGCLNNSYTVGRETLQQQAALAPEARGIVRGTQRLGIQSDPGGAVGPPIFYSVGPRRRLVRRQRRPQRGGGRFAVVPGTGETVSPGARRPVEVRGPDDERPPVRSVDTLPDEVSGEGRDAPGGDALSSGGSERRRRETSDDDEDGSGEAIAFVIAGVAIGLSLAATEGMRFEGDLRVSPDHPLHLRGPGGQGAWVPLSGLTPELAAWADDAVLLESDGLVERLARAPLNRRGFAFSFDLGVSAENTAGRGLDPIFASRLAVGGFPVHGLGFLFGTGVGVASTLEWRLYGEVQVYPLQFTGLEIGLYGQFGQLYGEAQDPGTGTTGSADTLFGAGGALLQVDLTTRLAFTLRGGVLYAPDPSEAWRPELLLGIAVY